MKVKERVRVLLDRMEPMIKRLGSDELLESAGLEGLADGFDELKEAAGELTWLVAHMLKEGG